MRFHETHDPDVLVTRYGRKIVANIFFSLLLFAIGIGSLLAGLGAFGLESDAPPRFAIIVGVGLSVAGLGVLTYRRGCTLDRRRGLLIQWRGAFGLRQEETMPLDSVRCVILRCEKRKNPSRDAGASGYTVYPVWVAGRVHSLKLSDELEYEEGLATAEHAAQLLGVEWEDRSDHADLKTEWW